MKLWRFYGVSAVLALALAGPTGCREKPPAGTRTITILATNDIHGGVESEPAKDGRRSGGLALLGGAVRAIREGLQARYGDRSGVLLVDAGDQFQGTLLSNHDEGQLVFRLMNEVGYDAVVPGNHDYDFGPIGWLDDRTGPGVEDTNPRGALERLARQARFPLISANTYLKNELVGLDGRRLTVTAKGCVPEEEGALVDWSRARRPGFLHPFAIRKVAGLRVAMVGIDHHATSVMSTPENITDLCFRDEVETYLELRRELEGRAEVFVLVMHQGDAAKQREGSEILERILKARADAVHVAVAGHTHFVNSGRIEGVPLVQSGAGGRLFGRIDVTYDFDTRRVRVEETQAFAGIPLRTGECEKRLSFCSELGANAPESNVAFEGVRVEEEARLAALIGDSRAKLAPLASRRLGRALEPIRRDRVSENALTNIVADWLRERSRAEIAMLTSSALRDDLPAGEIDYERLFKTFPFNNRAVVLAPMTGELLMRLLGRGIQTCGSSGTLAQSGLRVVFERDCARAGDTGKDKAARLLRVETLAGELIFDAAQGGLLAGGERRFEVATLDFLAEGGSGYADFTQVPIARTLGLVREELADDWEAKPVMLENRIDGRWKQVAPPAESGDPVFRE
ncbi:MAG: 5'-nucleotidase C-terminal domain-containing protein [Oligoflexia bacterium]|nr:5'-nucleotidase C-terminal domain-containing protein [Oligoflexia bacterium]